VVRPPPLSFGVDMTFRVKGFLSARVAWPWAILIRRVSDERAPVITTVDPAAIRGWGPT
jgi:hypothetical protein